MRRDLTLDLSKTAPFLKENELDYLKNHTNYDIIN